ncbi:OmpA family protein [Psychroserpens ponticola]|uniref:OmpA family protein n=1 Tax=Psychroserpens ponticola TaxID=2932268 RepID=A0ABY7RU79_9FLAO|nr:OmpA family protein [Psychroserpens ponticola]WCO00230.1 OmpA family protein [Psychroserpens ponticola]
MQTNIILIFFFLLNMHSIAQSKENELDLSKDELITEIIIDNYIPPILFEFNSIEFNEINRLKNICNGFIKWKVKKILLTGHCSNSEFNLNSKLSKLRAEKVKNLMIEYGIKKDIIEIIDHSKEQPKDSTGNNEINQRVEIIIQET